VKLLVALICQTPSVVVVETIGDLGSDDKSSNAEAQSRRDSERFDFAADGP
jgi:hypothetical protein